MLLRSNTDLKLDHDLAIELLLHRVGWTRVRSLLIPVRCVA